LPPPLPRSQDLELEIPHTTVTLDFDARVPIPFSVFPSTYRESDAVATEEKTTIRVAGREDFAPRRDEFRREETRVFEDERSGGHKSREEDVHVKVEETRDTRGRRSRQKVDIDLDFEEGRLV